jgi:hypothetical protein
LPVICPPKIKFLMGSSNLNLVGSMLVDTHY